MDNALTEPNRGTRTRTLLLAIVTLLVVVTIGAAGLEYTRTLRSDSIGGDQGLFAEMALIQLNGGTLYRDLWDNKPPTVFWMMGPFIQVLGNTARAIKFEAVTISLVFAAVMAALAYRVTGSKAAAAVAGGIIFLYGARVNRTETTLHMAMLGAAAALLAVVGRGRLLWVLAAGLVFAAGVFAKQPAIVELPVLVALAVYFAPTRRRHAAIGVVFGAVLGAALVFGWAIANGSFSSFWERVFTSNVQYVVGADGRWHFTDVAEELADESQLDQTLLFLAPVVTLALVSLTLQLRAGQRLRLLGLVLGWLALALLAASIGRGFKTNYFHQALPPLVLLVALGVPHALRLQAGGQLALAIVALVASLFFSATLLDPFAPPSNNRVHESREVAALMAAETSENGCVWMWGYLNYLNYLADRSSCTAVPYDAHTMKAYKYPVVANRSEFIHDLLGRQPSLHVLRSDYAYFPQLQRYADRYLGDLLLDNGGYRVYDVDRASWQPVRLAYNREIVVIGYDLWADASDVCAGAALPLALTWEQASQPEQDYAYSVYVAGADGAIFAAYEGALDPDRPTTTWDVSREPFLGGTVTLVLPESLTPGDYMLMTGLRDALGDAVDSELTLTSLTIRRDCDNLG